MAKILYNWSNFILRGDYERKRHEHYDRSIRQRA